MSTKSPPPDAAGQFAYTGDDDTEPFVPLYDYALPDPDDDPTPDFIKQDDDGWTRLKFSPKSLLPSKPLPRS